MNDSVALLEAVETLSNLAETGDGIGVMEEHSFNVQGKPVSYRSIHWISAKGGKDSVRRIRRLFQIIYDYVIDKEQDVEGIRAIMHLADQAAHKLDVLGIIKTEDLGEYRNLSDFYKKQIEPKVDQAKLGMWMLALTKNALEAKRPVRLRGVHHQTELVDLEAVKSDKEYELFFLKKEDGTHFYNPRLLRSIQLVCHFGERFYDKRDDEDPFAQIGNWFQIRHQVIAKTLLESIKTQVSRFYRMTQKQRENDLVIAVKKCLMALMLASQSHEKGKNSDHYFVDFQKYFREILYSSEYHKLIHYSAKTKNAVGKCLEDLIQRIARGIYREISLYKHLFPHVGRMIEEALKRNPNGDNHELWSILQRDYRALSKYAKGHVTGSLERLLEDLHTHPNPNFDPWMQRYTPSRLYRMKIDDKIADCLQMPSPIIQEFIHKAAVNEEFKNFIRGNAVDGSHLIFNMQDRTSWKEHARCKALEELQGQKPFQEQLHVVTFAKHTDFYHQTENYAKEHSAELFKNNLKEHLSDANTGFYFPQELSILAWEHLDSLLDEIHTTYFSGKNVLTREQRLDFIEIAYLCLQMHLLAKLQPASFSFLCKDGVDEGAASAATFLAAVKLLTPGQLTAEDRNMINYVLHTPALLNRERVIQPGIFQRFINAVRTLEGVREREGAQAYKRLSKYINLPVFLA